MKLIISKINEKFFEGEFESVVLPGGRGELEIMPNHSPLLSKLRKGEIRYKTAGKVRSIKIEKGFVEVNKNEVIVVL